MSDLEIDGHLLRARKLAAILLRTPQQTDEGMPGCYFGGRPTLPPHIDWPTYKSGVPGLDPVPLHFILQINLKYLPRALDFPEMPNHGTIFVFVEPMFAPQEFKQGPSLLQKDAATIIYVADDVSKYEPREAPSIPDINAELENGKTLKDYVCESYLWMLEGASAVNTGDGLNKWPLSFLLVDTYPPLGELQKIEASERCLAEAADAYQEVSRRGLEEHQKSDYLQGNHYAVKTPHQLFGWHNMDRFPDYEYFERRGIKEDVPCLSTDSVLLLTLHSEDETIGFEYVGGLNLAFWVKRNELAVGDFGSLTVWEQ